MAVTRRNAMRAGLARHSAAALLVLTTSGLAVGGLLHLAGAGGAGNAAWLVTGACGVGYAVGAIAGALRRGRAGVDVIALLALTGAMAVGELLAAAVISVMLASGRALEAWAAGRARHDLQALLAAVPRTARRRHGEALETVPLDAIGPGDILVVAPGELVPVDGMVTAGSAVIDESALTGEPLPVERGPGQAVRSGTVNAGAPFGLRASARAADSTYAGIVRLVTQAETAKPPFVRLADRYALWFLAASVAAAAAAWAVAGPVRAVAVLVVATPCPLILAAPVAWVAGMSVSARRGVVVKGGGVLERLAQCTTLLCDKTGTLTTGRPQVADVIPAGPLPAREVLAFAASLDQVSQHVLAGAVVAAAAERGLALTLPTDAEEVAGQGIRGTVNGHPVAVGKAGWAGITGAPGWAETARRRARLQGALTVFVAVDRQPAGVLILHDSLRPDARRTVRTLRQDGIQRIVIVTGDRADVADSVGALIGADEVLAERSPAGKLDAVRQERSHAPTVMVGDGVNDAPALALADVGIAVAGPGVISAEAADAVLTAGSLERLGEVRVLARRTRLIAVESVAAGMAMSLLAMGAAAVGFLPAVWGALLQEAIDVVVIGNALRALRPRVGHTRLTAADAALTKRFHDEHPALGADIDQLCAAADALETAPPAEAVALGRRAHQALAERVAPHELAEERELYPALNRILGGADPTAPMSRAHAEIAAQIIQLGHLLDDIGAGPPGQSDITDLRRLLYSLHAILRLHTAQEEESYLSLGEAAPASAAKSPPALAGDASAADRPAALPGTQTAQG